MQVKVKLCAFSNPHEEIPEKLVEVDVVELNAQTKTLDKLNLVFRNGQNEIGTDNDTRSVAMGDVIVFDDQLYQVTLLGFRKITNEQYSELIDEPQPSGEKRG